jgi:hypothetical protein
LLKRRRDNVVKENGFWINDDAVNISMLELGITTQLARSGKNEW